MFDCALSLARRPPRDYCGAHSRWEGRDISSDQVVIAAAGTEPSVTVPLGWGLSDATFDQLLTASEAQASSATCAVPDWTEYRCVGDLLDLFG